MAEFRVINTPLNLAWYLENMAIMKLPHSYMAIFRSGGFALTQRKIATCIIFSASIFSVQLHANTNNISELDKRLLKSCDKLGTNPTHPDGAACTYYVQGYLAGAWGINNVKASKLNEVKEKASTWTERAHLYKSSKRNERFRPIRTTYYCAPDDNPELQILNKLKNNLTNPIESMRALHAQIYEAITQVCPSDEKKNK